MRRTNFSMCLEQSILGLFDQKRLHFLLLFLFYNNNNNNKGHISTNLKERFQMKHKENRIKHAPV